MMILGFAGVGFMAYRRKAKPAFMAVIQDHRTLNGVVMASGMLGWSPLPFPKDGRLRLIDFPIEKIIIARPRVYLGPANLTAETARMFVGMLLPCRGVRQPAIGTAKIFGRPYVACHPAIMQRTEHVSSPEVCHNQ
jgi:hypothetical protein